MTRVDHDPAVERRLESAGRATPGMTMAVLDPTGESVEPGEVGEICIKGPCVMSQYWGRPEATADTLRNGWLHTGDVGRMDNEGFVYIVDRLKDMIVVGGMKVFPAEVERVLLHHPAVSQCAVVGFEDPVMGEKVVAFLVGQSDDAGAPERLRAHC